MGNIKWDPSWNIGHADIDAQHRQWVELFNDLENAFLSTEKIDMVAVQKKTFRHILEYTRHHFASEEKAMQEANYPDSPAHWRLHKEFDKIVYEKYREFESGEPILNSELLALIKNWLLHHIQTEDQKFGRFLQDKKNP